MGTDQQGGSLAGDSLETNDLVSVHDLEPLEEPHYPVGVFEGRRLDPRLITTLIRSDECREQALEQAHALLSDDLAGQ